MKKSLLFVILMLIPIIGLAQLGNLYLNHNPNTCSGKVKCGACFGSGVSYGYRCMSCGGSGVMNCAMCAGYRMGKQRAELHEQQRRANPKALWATVVENLGYGYIDEDRYERAISDLEILTSEHDDGFAYLILGNMYEMGIGDAKDYDYAKTCYNLGADAGNKDCRTHLARIKRGEYLNSQSKKMFKKYWADMVSNATAAVNSFNYNIGGSSSYSSGSSTSGRTCSGCGGTGKCTGCSGEGKYWVDSGMYTGSGSHSRVNCGSCGGSGGVVVFVTERVKYN